MAGMWKDRVVRSIALGVALALIAIVPASSDDVPFAAPPPPHPGQPDAPVLASLGDLMGFVQMRHIKRWYAGKAKNWGLARYELAQLEDTLSRAAVRYVNIPVEYIIKAGKPLGDMRDAATAKDAAKFMRGYSELTAACNACHTAGDVGFIHIQPPTASPYSDQAY
jgi:mono/diheme cytochrome c family protein